MRFLPLSLFFYLTLVLATSPSPSTSEQTTSTSPPPETPLTDSSSDSWSPPIPFPLQQFIANFNQPHPASPSESPYSPPESPPDLHARQAGIAGAGPDTATTIATQMSPITTYVVGGQQVVYTQTFPATPEPWNGPVNGEIGLGTIQGNVGTVRSR